MSQTLEELRLMWQNGQISGEDYIVAKSNLTTTQAAATKASAGVSHGLMSTKVLALTLSLPAVGGAVGYAVYQAPTAVSSSTNEIVDPKVATLVLQQSPSIAPPPRVTRPNEPQTQLTDKDLSVFKADGSDNGPLSSNQKAAQNDPRCQQGSQSIDCRHAGQAKGAR
jgi:hypothetical protein